MSYLKTKRKWVQATAVQCPVCGTWVIRYLMVDRLGSPTAKSASACATSLRNECPEHAPDVLADNLPPG